MKSYVVRALVVAAAGALLPAVASDVASAATLACGSVVLEDTVVANDIGPCPGDGIVAGADNITIDLTGHRVSGDGNQGATGDFGGIRIPSGRSGVTVKGGVVTGFETGVVVQDASLNTITNLLVTDNVGSSISESANELAFGHGIALYSSSGNRVSGNLVTNNGRRFGIAIMGPNSNNNLIEHNNVLNTIATGTEQDTASGTGIFVSSGYIGHGHTLPKITGNRVLMNAVRNNQGSGILMDSNFNGAIDANAVERNGFGPGAETHGFMFGIRLAKSNASLNERMNTTIGYNVVQQNAVFGIEVGFFATGNTIRSNDARGNGLHAVWYPPLDVEDGNPNCRSPNPLFAVTLFNTWEGNAFFSGNQPCVGTPLPAP